MPQIAGEQANDPDHPCDVVLGPTDRISGCLPKGRWRVPPAKIPASTTSWTALAELTGVLCDGRGGASPAHGGQSAAHGRDELLGEGPRRPGISAPVTMLSAGRINGPAITVTARSGLRAVLGLSPLVARATGGKGSCRRPSCGLGGDAMSPWDVPSDARLQGPARPGAKRDTLTARVAGTLFIAATVASLLSTGLLNPCALDDLADVPGAFMAAGRSRGGSSTGSTSRTRPSSRAPAGRES